MEKDIGKIQKGEYEGTVTDIVVGIKEYNGKIGVDIREFATSEKYTGPTKKGLRIPAEKFEEFKTLINSVNTSDLQESSEEATSSDVPSDTQEGTSTQEEGTSEDNPSESEATADY